MDAKLKGVALGLLEFDGVWECTFQYTSGFDDLLNLPRQSFLTVFRNRLLGQDQLGVIWSGSLGWRPDQSVIASVIFDPSAADEGVFVTSHDGHPQRDPVRHDIILSVVIPGERMTLIGRLEAGPIIVEGKLTRLRMFDGPAV